MELISQSGSVDTQQRGMDGYIQYFIVLKVNIYVFAYYIHLSS
jgi:hypothetical protein